MNAIPSFEAFKFAPGGADGASKAFSDAAENYQAFTDALVSGIEGAERARTELLASSIKALQQHATGVAAFARASGPHDALELQQQFARQALDLHHESVNALRRLATAWTAAFKPLQARYTSAVLSASE